MPDADRRRMAGGGGVVSAVAVGAAILVVLLGGLWILNNQRDRGTVPLGASTSVSPSITALATTPARTLAPVSDVVVVPDIRRKSVPDAERAISHSGLRFKVVTEDIAGYADDHVIDSLPQHGSKVRRGGTVTIRVAMIRVSVPNVTGLPIAAAESLVRNRGLVPVRDETMNTDPARSGQVFTQQPPAGQQVRHGTHVSVRYYAPASRPSPAPTTVVPTASIGPDPDLVAVPNVAGKLEHDAERMLTGVSLKYKVITVADATHPDGTVLSTIPAAGDHARRETVITIRLAITLVTVPTMIGQNVADATAELTRLGLPPSAHETTNADPRQSEKVFAQDPDAGQKVRHGTHVSVTFYGRAVVPSSLTPAPSDSPSPEPTDTPSPEPTDTTSDEPTAPPT